MLRLSAFVMFLPLCLLLGPGQTQQLPKRSLGRVEVADTGAALPVADEMEQLARTDAIVFVENCLRRYQREVQGYRVVMQKQERINGTLYPKEVIDVSFKEKPHSVLMVWREGARLAERSLYVEGENGGKLLARPNGRIARALVGDVVSRDVDGADARNSGRYTMADFGLKMAAERVLASLRECKLRGDYHVEYLGIRKLPEAGDRPCYTFRQTFAEPDREGIKTATVSVDTETWLQVGSVLQREDGSLVGAYYFRDLHLNPQFDANTFTRASLTP